MRINLENVEKITDISYEDIITFKISETRFSQFESMSKQMITFYENNCEDSNIPIFYSLLAMYILKENINSEFFNEILNNNCDVECHLIEEEKLFGFKTDTRRFSNKNVELF